MATKAREIGLNHLNQVCSLSEAMRAWKKGRSTLIYAIDTGHVTARRIGRDWIITVPSLISWYGLPHNPIRR